MNEEGEAALASRVLYLSYDGMTDPLGQSQVLPYLTGLASLGHSITLVSFEKPHRRDQVDAIRKHCDEAGIEWHPQPYTKRPPILSTVLDIRRMQSVAGRLHRKQGFDLTHCRSTLAALVGLRMKRQSGVPFLFDMRGFWADERVDGGLWKLRNPLYRTIYRFFKARERQLLHEADAVVSLTHAASNYMTANLPARVPVDVIPCCADLETFRPITPADRLKAREQLGIRADQRVAVYLGSLGTWYLLDEMLDAFAVQRRRSPDALMLWITPDDPRLIIAAARKRGLPDNCMIIRSASRAEVPRLLAAADYGLFFIKPAFSKQASSPVKLGEMMAMGLPAVTNAGIGDVDLILTESGAGVSVDRFDDEAYATAFQQLENASRDEERWNATTTRWFDLAAGVCRYDAIYRRLNPDSLDTPQPDTR